MLYRKPLCFAGALLLFVSSQAWPFVTGPAMASPATPSATAAPQPLSPAEQAAKEQAQIDRFPLPDGKMLDLAEKKFSRRPFSPDPKLLGPYAGSSVGDRVAFSIVDGRNIVDAPQPRQLAQDAVDRLLTAWGGPHPDFHVEIEAKSGFAAEATPQGIMFVPLGAFDLDPKRGAATENDLALLLGHELGHYLLHHIEQRAFRQQLVDILAITASGWMTYGAVERTTADGAGNVKIAADPATVRRAYIAGLATTTLLGDMIGSNYTQRSETEADLIGIDLAKEAKYHITESEIDNFITRHSADALEKSERMERLKAVVQAASAELNANASKDVGNPFGMNFGTLFSAASSKMIDLAFEELQKSLKAHPDPVVRLGVMKRYYKKAYSADADAEQLTRTDTSHLIGVKRAETVKPVLDTVKRAEVDELALLVGGGKAVAGATTNGAGDKSGSADAKAAAATVPTPPTPARQARVHTRARLASNATQTPKHQAPSRTPLRTSYESYSSTVEGNVQELQYVNPVQARLAWREASNAKYPSVLSAHSLGDAYARADMRDQLTPVVDYWRRRIGATDPIIDLMVGEAVAKGDLATAETLAARCVTYDSGRYYPNCALQLGYDPMQKGIGAKTPAGQEAFRGKSFEKQFSFLASFAGLFK